MLPINLIDEKSSSSSIPAGDSLRDLKELQAIFVDIDPNYIYEKILDLHATKSIPFGPQMVQYAASSIAQNKAAPKVRSFTAKAKQRDRLRALQHMKVDITAAVEGRGVFGTSDFYDVKSKVAEDYMELALVYLQNAFPYVGLGHIRGVLGSNSNHYLPSLRLLEAEFPEGAPPPKKRRRKKKGKSKVLKTWRPPVPVPEWPSERFYTELAYSRQEKEVTAARLLVARERARRMESARREGRLVECGCCFNDDNLAEDMLECSRGHAFCKECIRRTANEVIGAGKVGVGCLLMDGCKGRFPLAALADALPPAVFNGYTRRLQTKEIEEAGLEGLEKCPFCDYAVIMESDSNSILTCRNPDCGRQSCRKCKEAAHIPLRCDEVERKSERDMRTYVEDQMSDALLRQCWKCKRRFFKTEGCNHMTCSCGAEMCYQCGARLKKGKYMEHFRKEMPCKLTIDTKKFNEKRVKAAHKDALFEYKMLHPELVDVKLKHNPARSGKQKGRTKKMKASKREAGR